MKPNLTRLPWTQQGGYASGNHQIPRSHEKSHKYLYQLEPTCEQKPIGQKKKHIYERKTHKTMADFNLKRC